MSLLYPSSGKKYKDSKYIALGNLEAGDNKNGGCGAAWVRLTRTTLESYFFTGFFRVP